MTKGKFFQIKGGCAKGQVILFMLNGGAVGKASDITSVMGLPHVYMTRPGTGEEILVSLADVKAFTYAPADSWEDLVTTKKLVVAGSVA